MSSLALRNIFHKFILLYKAFIQNLEEALSPHTDGLNSSTISQKFFALVFFLAFALFWGYVQCS